MEIVLSEKYSIHVIDYEGNHDKDDFLKRAYEIIKLKKTHPSDKNHFFYVPFRCSEIDELNEQILSFCEYYKEYEEFAVQNWVYIMNNKTQNEIYHTHINLVEGDERIKTDWTFCFYIQIPEELDGDDGKISFRTEDGVEHLFLPKEGEIIIFPADLEHTPKLIKNAKTDRVVIAGNISLNPLKKINDKSFI
jgi:hypothetical protein